jgi:hypothetical protein
MIGAFERVNSMTTERELREREWRRKSLRAQKRLKLSFISPKRGHNLINLLILAIFLLSISIAVKNHYNFDYKRYVPNFFTPESQDI